LFRSKRSVSLAALILAATLLPQAMPRAQAALPPGTGASASTLGATVLSQAASEMLSASRGNAGAVEAQATATVAALASTAQPTPVATKPAPATPTPAATHVPDPRVASARWLQSIGDCAGARRELADLLAGKPEAADAAEARYRMAQCYLRDDAANEAAAMLRELLAQAPKDDPYRAPANFLLGDAYTRLGRWKDAEKSYLAYLPLASEIEAVTWQRIGAARKADGNPIAAAQAYSTALQSSFDWTNTVAIRRALADLSAGAGDYRGAAAQYDLLRGQAANNSWAAEMQWLAGSAFDKAGDRAAARQRWQAAVDADPKSHYAYLAVVALLNANAPVDEYQRGVVDYYSGLYELAIAAFDRLRVSDPTGRQGAAWYYTALSYLNLQQTDRALAELGNLIAAYPDSPYWADAWLARGRALDSAGKTGDAIAAYQQLAKLRPDAAQAPKALWQAAVLLAGEGRVAAATDQYLALARLYPGADEGWRGYQAAGLNYFRQGDWRRAGDTWDEMARAALSAWTRPVAYYWLGRAQAAANEPEAARRSWQAAWESDPSSYYGLLAADWSGRQAASGTATPGIAETRPAGPTQTPTPQPTLSPSSATPESQELTTWLRNWAGAGTLDLPPAVLTDPDWKRGQTLLALGLRSQGLAALDRVMQRQKTKPWALAALSLAFRDLGAHRLSLLSAETLAELWTGGTMRTAPAALQRLAYPLPFADLIRQEAAKSNVDPRLLAAMIRQESRFETSATSSAGAQGLMQVMPATAQGIASRLGWTDFEPQQAYWPYVNVALGANYIGTWLAHFEGSLAAALAAYNGGPGNAARWRKWAPDDDDLMTALIDFNETRVYVQTIYAQYDMYKRLYPETP
jgi:soluble lytic murein transglycosylase